MPYTVTKKDKKYLIKKKSTDKVVGKSDSKEKAKASVRARFANEKPKR